MDPYYEDEYVTLYHGDCRDVVERVTCDMVLTDIPYGEVNRESSGLRDLHKGSADRVTMPLHSAVSVFTIPDPHTVYSFCGTEQVSELRGRFVDRGYTTRLGVWEKTNPSPMNGESLWLSSVECCVFARSGNATFNEHCASPVWRGPSRDEADHPTVKPGWLLQRIVQASSNTGDTVFDPFAGSGSTLLAAKNLSRKAIGVEIDERYCEVAAERLSQQVLDL